MPPDVNETFDPPVGELVSEEHRAVVGDAWAGVASAFQHPPDVAEPPIGTVIAYQMTGTGGVKLDYVTFRAGDGKWYTTGKLALQGASWNNVRRFLRSADGVVRYATGWAALNVGVATAEEEVDR